MPNFCLINKEEVVVLGRGWGGWGGGRGWDWWAKPECQNLQQTPPSDGVAFKGQSLWGRGLGFVHHSTSRSPQFSNIRSLYVIYSI